MPAHREVAFVRRGVSFAEDVQIIGTSEIDVSNYGDEASMTVAADALFEESGESEAVDNDLGVDVEPDETASIADASAKAPPGKQETVSSNTAATDIRNSALARVITPPRSSSLGWRRRPTAVDDLVASLSTPIAQPSIRSPPPPYTDEAADIEEDELIFRRDPVPSYYHDHSPPTYAQAWWAREAGNDLVLEDLFHGAVGWFQGVGAEVTDAWNALTYNDPMRRQ